MLLFTHYVQKKPLPHETTIKPLTYLKNYNRSDFENPKMAKITLSEDDGGPHDNNANVHAHI